jgi:hypothetical protein
MGIRIMGISQTFRRMASPAGRKIPITLMRRVMKTMMSDE